MDHIREMDDPATKPMISPSRGIHVVLPDYYSPVEMGLIIPKTSDGRVIFLVRKEKKQKKKLNSRILVVDFSGSVL